MNPLLAVVHAFTLFALATSPVQPLAFPALYPTGVNHFGTDRPVKTMPAMYFRMRLDSEDPRFQVGRCPSNEIAAVCGVCGCAGCGVCECTCDWAVRRPQ